MDTALAQSLLILPGALLQRAQQNNNKVIFSLTSPSETGINFSNDITEDSVFNIMSYEYMYNGGGVAVGDINNDGLQDIYFLAIWFRMNFM